MRILEKWNGVKREGEETRKEERKEKNGEEKVRKIEIKGMEKRRNKFLESKRREEERIKISTRLQERGK